MERIIAAKIRVRSGANRNKEYKAETVASGVRALWVKKLAVGLSFVKVQIKNNAAIWTAFTGPNRKLDGSPGILKQ